MRSVKAVNRSLYVDGCLLWISHQGSELNVVCCYGEL